MPVSGETFQKICAELSSTKNSVHQRQGFIANYDDLMDNVFELANEFPSGKFWGAVIQGNGEGKSNIRFAPFNKDGRRVGDLFSVHSDLSDAEISGDLSAAFRQFPSLILPTKIDGYVQVSESFIGDGTRWGGSVLTYAAAIKYFTYESEKLKDIKKRGVLTYEKFNSCVSVEQLFLDEDNNPIVNADGSSVGRKNIFGLLDKELMDILDGNDVLVVD